MDSVILRVWYGCKPMGTCCKYLSLVSYEIDVRGINAGNISNTLASANSTEHSYLYYCHLLHVFW